MDTIVYSLHNLSSECALYAEKISNLPLFNYHETTKLEMSKPKPKPKPKAKKK